MTRPIHAYLVKLWFLLNVFVAVYPPLHWAGSQHAAVSPGLPTTFVYFMGLGLSITLSILYACWQDAASGELTP